MPPEMGPCKGDTVGDTLLARDTDAAKPKIMLFSPTTIGPTMQAGAELLQKVWGEVGVEVTLKSGTDAEVGPLLGGQLPWDAAIVPLNLSLPSQTVPFMGRPHPRAPTSRASTTPTTPRRSPRRPE